MPFTTDQGGRYRFFALPVGPYEVRVTKDGFAEGIRSGIRLAVGQDATVDVGLRVGQVSEQVRVTEDAPVVSLTTQDISGLVGEQQIKDLPLNGRSYDLLLTLNPGIVNFTWEKTGGIGVSNSTTGNDFSVSGNRPQQNIFLLNGVEFTGAAENNMQPGGSSQELLGVDAVREFNVLRDSYGAEYGKRPGGQVTIVTQSGTNQLHGSVLRVSAQQRSGRTQFLRSGVGATLPAQPVWRLFRRTHQKQQNFPVWQLRGVAPASASNFGGVCSRRRLAGCAVSRGSATAEFVAGVPIRMLVLRRAESPRFSAALYKRFGRTLARLRLDHAVSSRDSLSAAYTIDDGDDFTATVLDPYSSDILTLREQVFSLDETHSFSRIYHQRRSRWIFARRLFLYGSANAGNARGKRARFLVGHQVGAVVVGGSAASNPQAAIGLAGSNNGSNLRIARNLFTFEDRVTLTRGRHQLTFGAWFQPFQSNETIALSQYGQLTFSSLQNFLLRVGVQFSLGPDTDSNELALALRCLVCAKT